MAKNYAAQAFVFDGDHGDEPDPGQVMTWSQWDDKPLAIVNHDGIYMAAIVVSDTACSSRDAIQDARQQLNTWTESAGDVKYLEGEIVRLTEKLSDVTRQLEIARTFGYDDRLAEILATIPAIAHEFTGLVA
jgi:hypothetical protein